MAAVSAFDALTFQYKDKIMMLRILAVSLLLWSPQASSQNWGKIKDLIKEKAESIVVDKAKEVVHDTTGWDMPTDATQAVNKAQGGNTEPNPWRNEAMKYWPDESQYFGRKFPELGSEALKNYTPINSVSALEEGGRLHLRSGVSGYSDYNWGYSVGTQTCDYLYVFYSRLNNKNMLPDNVVKSCAQNEGTVLRTFTQMLEQSDGDFSHVKRRQGPKTDWQEYYKLVHYRYQQISDYNTYFISEVPESSYYDQHNQVYVLKFQLKSPIIPSFYQPSMLDTHVQISGPQFNTNPQARDMKFNSPSLYNRIVIRVKMGPEMRAYVDNKHKYSRWVLHITPINAQQQYHRGTYANTLEVSIPRIDLKYSTTTIDVVQKGSKDIYQSISYHVDPDGNTVVF